MELVRSKWENNFILVVGEGLDFFILLKDDAVTTEKMAVVLTGKKNAVMKLSALNYDKKFFFCFNCKVVKELETSSLDL